MNKIIPLASFDGKTVQPCEAADEIPESALYVITRVAQGFPFTADRWGAERRRDETIESIRIGEVKDVVSVHAYDLESGRCWDAGRQVAEALAAYATNSAEALSYHAQSFVEHVLGVEVGNELPGAE